MQCRYHLYVKEQKKSGFLGVTCDSVKVNSRQIWMLSFLLCANTNGDLQINVFSTSIDNLAKDHKWLQVYPKTKCTKNKRYFFQTSA